MGKALAEEEELPHPSSTNFASETPLGQNGTSPCNGFWLSWIGFKCVLVVCLSIGVLLSAVFWLPPFLNYGDRMDLDLDWPYRGHDIVASFKVKPVSTLDHDISQLEGAIFDELGVPTIKVVILSLEPSGGSDITRVVFAVDPETKHSKLSDTARSLVRSSFVSLVLRQLTLHLTETLFEDPFSFEVLKFSGGITVIPQQGAFLLQKVQILFNFTIYFSIDEIQEYFDELTSQLRSGLHLTPFENLYVSLTNWKGSTVGRPTIVQTSVVLAVGITPTEPRLKQLAQTIKSSRSKNLGLNNTIFGRVKQVRLSSILQHSLHGGDDTGTSWSPSPAPLPHPHHHHQHHNRHHHDEPPAPAPAPMTNEGSPASHRGIPGHKREFPAPTVTPTAAPKKSYPAWPPGCQIGHKSSRSKATSSRLSPTPAPVISHQHSAPSPRSRVYPPPTISDPVPVSSPLPSVVFAHAQPPTKIESVERSPMLAPSALPPSPSSASTNLLPTIGCPISLILALVLRV